MKGKVWIVILILSAAATAVGLVLGEAGMVLEKAIQVCLSCIGIG